MFRHPVIAWNEQSAGAKSCKRTGNADREVADDPGEAGSCCNTHDKLDHAGCKWSACILHALDCGAVDRQKSKKKIKWGDNRQVSIRIMINLLRWRGQKQTDDRVPEQKNPDAHNKIERLGLDQACTHAETDPVFFSGTEILCHVIRNSSHHGIVNKDRDLICFGSSSISGYSGSSHGIDHGLHGKLPDTHDGHLKSHCKTDPEMEKKDLFQMEEIIFPQTQDGIFFQTEDQTEQSREKLRKDCGQSSSGNSHLSRQDKKKIQKNI